MHKKGFTLVEVLTVVLIGAMVILFAIPNYRKSQDKNRYLTASGVLMELGNGVNMFREDFPNLELTSGSVSYNAVTYSQNADPLGTTFSGTVSSDDLVKWLVYRHYLTPFPINSDNSYLKYTYAISTQGSANCGNTCTISGAVACMTGENANNAYTCAWVDKSGILHHN